MIDLDCLQLENVVNSDGVYFEKKLLEQRNRTKTSEQFTFEFDDVADRKDLDSKVKDDTTLFLYKTGIDSSFYSNNNNLDHRKFQAIDTLAYQGDFSYLNGKVVVDAGCGNGRYAKIIAQHCKTLYCLDFGMHIKSTKSRLSHLDNVVYVNCRLEDIPINSNAIDYIYSIGVIHHTPSPETSLLELVRILKKNSNISIWVYPKEYWGNFAKRIVSKTIRWWLLRLNLQRQVSFIKKVLIPIARIQMSVESLGLKYVFAPLFIINVPRHKDVNEMIATTIDYFLPEYIYTYSEKDLELMFKKCGLSFNALPFPTSAIGEKL